MTAKKLTAQKPTLKKEEAAAAKRFINGGERKPILVRLDAELASRLDARSETTGHTRIYHIVKALEAYLGAAE